MKIAEYARDRTLAIHRVASAVVLVSWVGVAFHFGSGMLAFRVGLVFGIATAAVWFAEAFATEQPKPSVRSGAFFVPKSSTRGIRFAGWFTLLVPPAFLALFLHSAS